MRNHQIFLPWDYGNTAAHKTTAQQPGQLARAARQALPALPLLLAVGPASSPGLARHLARAACYLAGLACYLRQALNDNDSYQVEHLFKPLLRMIIIAGLNLDGWV